MTVIDFEDRKKSLASVDTDDELIYEFFQNMENGIEDKFKFDYADVFKLHIEIKGSNLADNILNDNQKAALKKYGKINKAVSRDILISGEMALWQLHYIIQQLFGWHNEHLHRFSLPEDDFTVITENSASGWAELCGVILRFPEGDLSDYCWHDADYTDEMPLKNWFRSKYNSLIPYMGEGDHYLNNLNLLKEFFALQPTVQIKHNGKTKTISTKKADLKTLRQYAAVNDDINLLLGRLWISDVFTENCTKPDYTKWRAEQQDFINEVDGAEGLRELRELDAKMVRVHDLMHTYFLPNGNFKPNVPLKKQEKIIKTMMEAQDAEWEYERLMETYDSFVVPFANQLTYYYDYGDGWQVDISCTDVYSIDRQNEHFGRAVYFDKDGKMIANELYEDVLEVSLTHKPRCIDRDGVNVLDNIGGLEGFCEFLSDLHSNDKKIAEERREFAAGNNWTGRLRMSKNML